jgi:hypothetical protein
MSTNGLPGKRVDAYLAGIIPIIVANNEGLIIGQK